jgi:hypothetical protein
MDMIGHGIDFDDGLFFLSDDAHDITVELGFVLFRDEGLSAFNGEDDVYVDLCIGVGHGFPTEMSPLRGLIVCVDYLLQRCRPYGAEDGIETVFYTNAAYTGLISVCVKKRRGVKTAPSFI